MNLPPSNAEEEVPSDDQSDPGETNAPGWTGSLTPARYAYFFGREIERWAEARTTSG